MTEKYRNKYRSETARLQSWDYGDSAAYFITICTKDRLHFFGEIINGSMQLSEIGKTVENEWLKTPHIRPDMNLTLDEFVVMPDHFHALIIIGDNIYNTGRDAMHRVPTHDDTKNNGPVNQFGPQSKNLASTVRGFKSAVTTQVKKQGLNMHSSVTVPDPPPFAWQTRFYEHIVRHAQSFERIRNYIANNIANWKEGKGNDGNKFIR